MPSQRLGRAAIFAFGAAVAATGAGCNTSSTPADAYIGSQDAAYGGPPIDAGSDAFVGSLDAAYGAPPVDAGDVDTGLAAAYGAPPADAGAEDSGNLALYGSPPPPPGP